MDIKLKYIGNGAALLPFTDTDGNHVPGVPARDLTEAEARQFGGVAYLVKSGLYERVTLVAINLDGKQVASADSRLITKKLEKDGE